MASSLTPSSHLFLEFHTLLLLWIVCCRASCSIRCSSIPNACPAHCSLPRLTNFVLLQLWRKTFQCLYNDQNIQCSQVHVPFVFSIAVAVLYFLSFIRGLSWVCETILLYGVRLSAPRPKPQPGGPGRDTDPLPPSSAMVKKGWSYISTSPMGRTACTEPQCLYMGALYLPYIFTSVLLVTNTPNSSTTDTVLSTDSFIMKHTSRSKTEYNC